MLLIKNIVFYKSEKLWLTQVKLYDDVELND